MTLEFQNQISIQPTEESGGGTVINNQDITVTENGEYTAEEGYTGLGTVTVNVSSSTTTKPYTIKVIDYDGSIIEEQGVDVGDEYTLPSAPSHTGLTFQEWSCPVTITGGKITAIKGNIVVGAVYTTASGKSEFDIELTPATGLTVTLYIGGSKSWGDGTTGTSSSHTYTDYGSYTISCGGSISVSGTTGMFGQTRSTYNYYITAIRLADNITSLDGYTFCGCKNLKYITLSNKVTSVGQYCFSDCSAFKHIIIPSSVLSLNDYAFTSCRDIIDVAMGYGITHISNYTFSYCAHIESIVIPNSVTGYDSNAFVSCFSLANIVLSNNANISMSLFSGCTGIKSIAIPNGCSILSKAFSGCTNILEYDFSSSTSVNTLNNTDAFSYINQLAKIKVPTALLNTWKATSGWSSYANYIVGV